ncbi:Ig-like domain-containing protein [Flavobacterium channae]|uniref:Ig-like domain-containing protein n=1 Tax=Flavobacterium channae TaxID=2897181 RepID=UPI001E5D280D|nr:Ig-like domain-containing protein [Flavobacterium channae]UGS23283.1 Ig-like domain-containing protein [Flavobacterium channae]
MKNKIKFLKLVVILFFSFNTHSQVTVSVQNLQYTNNGQPTVYPSNCGNIDLASSISTSLYLSINLSKPNGQVVGLSDLRVYTQKSSSDSRIERSWIQIQESFWSTSEPSTYLTTANFSINSSDFNTSGGTLFVVFKSSGNVEYQTACSFTITKTPPPSFSLSPSTVSLGCGDTSLRTFTITPANIPSGANVTYSWNHPGWTLVSSTATSRTLQPNSTNNLPSNVTVTPSINSVTQATKTCVVSRAPFNTNTLSISGNNYVCDTGIYSINNLPSSVVIQSVTSSNNNIATVSLTGTNEILVTKVSDGIVSISATVQNTCNQIATISKENIQIGIPSNVNDAVISGSSSVCSNQYYTYTITEASHPCITTFNWDVSPNLQIISQNSNSVTVIKNPSDNQNSGYISYTIPNTNVEIRKGVWVGLPENSGLNILKIGSYDFYAGSWTTLKATYSALIYPESGNYNLTYEWIIPNSYVRNYTDTAYKDVNPRSSDQLNIGIRAWNECGCTDWFYKLFDVISAGTGGGGTGGGNVLTPAN